MKIKLIIAIAALMVFGLSIAAVAYTRTAQTVTASASCCKGDSCPMKNKSASASEKTSCCDNCDCCSGDSCPMKVKAEVSASAMKMADGKSCPMMDKASKAMHTEAKHETAAGEAKSCDCSCCGHDKEDKVVASK